MFSSDAAQATLSQTCLIKYPQILFQIPENSAESYQIKPVSGPSIIITISGTASVMNESKAIQMERGTVIFIPANAGVNLKICGKGNILLFRAFCAL